MADQPIRITPLGNLDKDSDYNLVREGNYVDALDVIKQDDEGQVFGSIQPTQRNRHAFSLGEVVAQNKKYRITVPITAGRYAVRFQSANRGNDIVDYNGPIAYSDVPSTAVQFYSLANWQAEGWTAQDTPNSALFNTTYPTVNGQTVIELELTVYQYYDYVLTSVGPDPVKIECIQEMIPTDLAGPLKDIGSYDMLGDLFVFSTSQDDDPTDLDLSVAGVGPVDSNGNYTGLTTISFTSNHNLQDGQAIGITNSNLPFLNGTFVVNSVLSPTEINIVTSTAWGEVFSASVGLVGDEVITVNTIGIGEIGVAEKNDDTDTWSYIRLIRSVELNFTTRNAIDSFAYNESSRRSVYFTDNFNRPGVFYYRGVYQEDGALEFINPDNPYSFGNINTETSLQTSVNPVDVDILNVFESGGNIVAGTKYYVVRQKTEDGDESPMSSPFGPVVVYNLDPKEQGVVRSYAIAAQQTADPSETRVRLKISNLDSGAYPVGELIVIESILGVVKASIIHEFTIPLDGVYEYTHTGFEDTIPISINEVLVTGIKEFSQILKAKNISSIDSRNVLSNVSTLGQLDLSEWTKTFRHTLFKDTVDESTLNNIGEYQQTTVTFEDVGLMMNETCRVGARVYLKGLGWTPWYWVDDIKVDNNPVNTANPDGENRRDGTFDDFQLTDNQSTWINGIDVLQDSYNNPSLWPSNQFPLRNNRPVGIEGGAYYNPDGSFSTSAPPGEEIIGSSYAGWFHYFWFSGLGQYKQHTKYYVPKVSFSINWDFIIPGGSRKNLINEVTAIEFGLGNLPNNVKASGMAVLSTKTQGQHQQNGGWGRAGYAESDYIREFDYQPMGFSNNQFGINAFVNFYSSGFPKYPYSGYSIAVTREEEVRDVFSFYSPDTTIAASESGERSGGNGVVAGATHVLVHGTYGRHKGLTGDQAERTDPDGNPVIVGGVAGGVPGGYNAGVFSVLHPFGPEYDSVDSIRIENSAFIDDTVGIGSIGPYSYKVWDSVVLNNGTGGGLEPNIPYLTREDVKVFKTESDIEYNLDPYYDRTDVRKMDQGIHYVQMFADESASYPSISNTQYVKIGDTQFFDGSTLPETIIVNGGDTSTSLFYFRARGGLYIGAGGLALSGSVLGYVSQSRSNLKALKVFPGQEDPDTGEIIPDPRKVYPYDYFGSDGLALEYLPSDDPDVSVNLEQVGISIWSSFLNSDTFETSVYDRNFDFDFLSVIQGSQSQGFQATPLTPGLNSNPTRITWSNRKLPGESLDSYRVFLPSSYKDLDFTFGEINDHQDINGELFTLQPRKFQLQFFNSRGTLQTTDGSIDIVVGESSVLNRDGKTLSSYGTDHKWSVIKGSSPGGKDVVYWFNQENGMFIRFGADGTVVLSDRGRIRAFSTNETKWTQNQYSPASNYGIRSVWDDRFKEAIWTFIGIRETHGDWSAGKKYNVGNIVTSSTNTNYPLDNIPDVYVCLVAHNAPEGTPTEPGVGSDWQSYWRLVEKDDPEYYSVFTLAFNELTNGFSTFYSHLPKTYLKWSNKFLSSNPLHRSEIYEHRYGYDKWYEYEGVWKESEPFIEGVVNYIPEQSKKFVAMQSLSDNAPDKIELRTKDHESFLVASDFDPEDDAWRSPIKNDILTSPTSDPNDDTVALLGSYMRVKFKFFNGVKNRLNNMIIKIRARLRRTAS